MSEVADFPLEILFLRDDDIPQYVEQRVADIGIIGRNVLLESGKEIDLVRPLGYASCRLSLAVPKSESYSGLDWFQHKKIATSYPNVLKGFLAENGIEAEIEMISGSVEIAPGIGLADAICDIVSSGSTLLSNGLREVCCLLESEAVLVAARDLPPQKQAVLEQLLFRMKSVQDAKSYKYILLNAPDEKLARITELLPGMNSPTILPLAKPGWSSLHSVIKADQFWDMIQALKTEGAEGILIVPIEKMIL